MVYAYIPVGLVRGWCSTPSIPREEQVVQSFFRSLDNKYVVYFDDKMIKELVPYSHGKILDHNGIKFKLERWREDNSDYWKYIEKNK